MTAGTEPGHLGLSVVCAHDPVVAVAGELDVASASCFAAVLQALIDPGHGQISVDCSELSFIDASGLGALADAHARVSRTDAEIRVSGVSALAYRIFEITGLVEPLRVERSEPNVRRESDEPHDATWHAAHLMAESARADALANTLSLMTALIPKIITTCDGASLTLRRGDHLVTAAASDDTVRELDRIQYSYDQGPCRDAANSGDQTHAPVLADEQRWDSFTPEARKRGMKSILSSPLIVGDRPMGALNLYSRREQAFEGIYTELASLFGTQTALLLDGPDLTTTHEFDDRINRALASRDVISRAQGVLMERLGIDAKAAYVALRRDSVNTSIPLRTCADNIVAETQRGTTPSDRDEVADE